jgi:hypothetical protein
VELLIRGQNTALRQVVVQAAALLRAQGPGVGSTTTAAGPPQAITAPAACGQAIPWGWISAAALMGTGATVGLTLIAWLQLSAQ